MRLLKFTRAIEVYVFEDRPVEKAIGEAVLRAAKRWNVRVAKVSTDGLGCLDPGSYQVLSDVNAVRIQSKWISNAAALIDKQSKDKKKQLWLVDLLYAHDARDAFHNQSDTDAYQQFLKNRGVAPNIVEKVSKLGQRERADAIGFAVLAELRTVPRGQIGAV